MAKIKARSQLWSRSCCRFLHPQPMRPSSTLVVAHSCSATREILRDLHLSLVRSLRPPPSSQASQPTRGRAPPATCRPVASRLCVAWAAGRTPSPSPAPSCSRTPTVQPRARFSFISHRSAIGRSASLALQAKRAVAPMFAWPTSPSPALFRRRLTWSTSRTASRWGSHCWSSVRAQASRRGLR